MHRVHGLVLAAFLAITAAIHLMTPREAFAVDASPQSKQAVITIKGMMCASCGQEVEKLLKKVAGVGTVQVEVAHDRATVCYDERKITPRQIVEAIRKAGYDASIPDEVKPAGR